MAAARSLLLAGLFRGAVAARCGFATRGAAGPGLGPGPDGREPDPDLDWEPEERELQEVASALKRQRAAVRFQKLRRQMQPPGAPRRTLTRQAMEQIRYLNKEFAETWSIPRLAEGFDVSTDVIRRVLKSKFVPTLERKLKEQKAVEKHLAQLQVAPWKPHSVSHLIPGSWKVPAGEIPSGELDRCHEVPKVTSSSTRKPGTLERPKRRKMVVQD
ncbi:neugrin [Suncus etruscus]|uniref:neugrin n=1 Tax=Suncus etruscus TaxID=109475 RepID=UPI00211061F6|nr:neugrin [Suncus etruscus]